MSQADYLDDWEEAAALADDLMDDAVAEPLRWMRWTPPQEAWLKLNPPTGVKLFRAGNQAIGKTSALIAEIIFRATGTHPYYETKPPPVEIWMVCTSWAQSVAIQKKFWESAPKAQLTTRTRDRFRIEDGWGKDNPAASFLNGSIVRFRTTNQGPEAQAGGTVDYVGIDEPPDEEVFRELRKRVTRSGGQVGMALTPVNRPCGWLKDQAAAGMIDEVHTRLTAAALIPIGSTTPLETVDPTTRALVPMDQRWIDKLRATTPAIWAPVVLDGEWDAAPEGVFFHCFDQKKHVNGRARFDLTRGTTAWVLGFDYAAADRELGHTAVLAQVQTTKDGNGRTQEAILVADEVVLSGQATNTEFAQRVLQMLDRNGIRWNQLRSVHGDNPVTSRWAIKSNIETMKKLAIEMQVPVDALYPRVLSAKEGTRSINSRTQGCQYLFERIASGNVVIHPRCETLVRGLGTWDFSNDHPMKDVIDALRYALKPYIFAPHVSGRTVLRVVG